MLVLPVRVPSGRWCAGDDSADGLEQLEQVWLFVAHVAAKLVPSGRWCAGDDSADGLEQLEQVWLQRERQTHSRNGRCDGQQRDEGSRLSICEHRRLLAGES